MRETDSAVAAEVMRASPLNLYGEPVFRVVWSQDRLDWLAGWWNDYDSQTGVFIRRVFDVRRGPKYQMAPRWIVEEWKPAEFFGSREMWEQVVENYAEAPGMPVRTVQMLGPYPTRGDYVHIWTCQDAEGKYMEITPTLARYTIDLALQPQPTNADLRSWKEQRKKQDSADLSKAVDDMLGDAFPFLGRTNNLTPKTLMQKIRDHKKDGKEL